MEIAPLSTIKKELNARSPKELMDCCLRLAKYKKENKELLNYLLFEAHDEDNFREELKEEIKADFSMMNVSSIYVAKKSIRRILRIVAKHIKFSHSKQTALELLICFCREMRQLDLPLGESKVMTNLYNRQLLQIHKILSGMDEDLQFDYQIDIEEINQPLI